MIRKVDEGDGTLARILNEDGSTFYDVTGSLTVTTRTSAQTARFVGPITSTPAAQWDGFQYEQGAFALLPMVFTSRPISGIVP